MAVPFLLATTELPKKNSQILYHLTPYLLTTLSLFPNPVSVPSPQSSRIVHTNVINTDNFEPNRFHTTSKETQWSRGISTWENVFVHEQSPFQIFILPVLSQTRVLQEKQNPSSSKASLHCSKYAVNLLIPTCSAISTEVILSYLPLGLEDFGASR